MKKLINYVGAATSIATLIAMVWIGVNNIQPAEASQEPEIRSTEDYFRSIRPQMRPSLWTRMSQEDRHCLALNVYHEARGESVRGQMAVVAVTLNRVNLNSYPDTVCGVVHQANRDTNGNPIRHQCQFSWYCDGQSDTPQDQAAWERVQVATQLAVEQYGDEGYDLTHGADHYHATWVDPSWANAELVTRQIGVHIFYDLR